ncbi:MAG TPA: twin-arginine translocase subunit TatC [Longimicrobiales bacterium]|nr:twin-arginine translocase subunit TatC [Longimicrobiales bacterium]
MKQLLRNRFRRPDSPSAEMPFFDHLEELRWRIIYGLLALVVATGFGFWLALHFDLLGHLKRPLDPHIGGDQLIALSITDPFMITFKLALTLGFIFASPIIVYQVWAFLAPALTKREKRAIVPALYMGVVLFCAGVAMGYFYVLPLTAKFLAGFQTESLRMSLTGAAYFGFVIRLLLAFGLVFQLPVVILILATLGLASSKFLADKRRYAYAAMTIGAALITPGDVTSTILMMGPLWFLYEVSIALTRLVERNRARREAEDAAEEAAAEANAAAAEADAGAGVG